MSDYLLADFLGIKDKKKDDGNLTTFGDEVCQEVFINLDGLVYPEQSSIFFTSQTKSFQEKLQFFSWHKLLFERRKYRSS
ncbi:hypothetical protein MiTe_03947 [Microcystis aeruginosa NIES-2520]|jgi:hypothetical protein|uniref:Uncharacterized protein n=1 Tax=Microcystis aeruginosa NIES-2520 TaxID=2303982 RepID=A0A5A5RKL0_MICAE|nr:hypothetical protein [Microcystis aeruginosa]GCA77094.1 hypothetical protein MiTe_03947 [Microcystis aeruginosa NIES-2520]